MAYIKLVYKGTTKRKNIYFIQYLYNINTENNI